MGVIVKQLEIDGLAGKRNCEVVFDAGASHTVIRKKVAEEFCILLPLRQTVSFPQADGKTTVSADYLTELFFTLEGYYVPRTAYVCEDLATDIIFGADSLQHLKMKLDFEREDIVVDPKYLRLMYIPAENGDQSGGSNGLDFNHS